MPSQKRREWLLCALLTVGVASGLAGCKDDEEPGGDVGGDADVRLDDAGDDTGPGDTGGVESDGGDGGRDAGGDASSGAFDLKIQGLAAPVKVQFDESGVLHVDCQTNTDCYAAQGYFHAEHRFFEMDLIRRQTRGQLAEVIGVFGLDNDKKFRHLMTTKDGKPLEEEYLKQVNEETRGMLEAYANGVNAWLDDMRSGENGATLTEEYDSSLVAKDNIRDWEPEDSIALYMQLAYQLSETATDDLRRSQVADALPAQVASDLYTTKPGIVSNTMDASGVMEPMSQDGLGGDQNSIEAFRRAKQRLAPASGVLQDAYLKMVANPSLLFGPRTGQDGSNNWVLSGDRTKSGKPLLADDPHLTLNNPAIWYFVELDSKTNGEGDLHVAGASIPAVPGIVVGQNENIAWGVTTARLDLADAYVEKLNEDGTAVMHEGKEVPLIEKEFTFKISTGGEQTETFEWVPHHGPLIAKDEEAGTAVSIRWVLQEPGSDINFISDLMRAGTVSEAMDAMEPVRAINQNWVFMDKDGSIGWYPKGAIPKRPWASAMLPNWMALPGEGSAEWQGYLASEDIPQMVDPPNGFVATANNDFDGSYTDGNGANDGHTPWQAPPAYGHRHKRIVDMIEAGGNEHTVQTMHDIQADTYSLHGETLVPHIVGAVENERMALSEDARKVVDALDAWTYTCPDGLDGTDPEEATKVMDAGEASESIGCAVFHVMIPYLTGAVFSDELQPLDGVDARSSWYRFQDALIYVFDDPDELANRDAYFDDTTTMGTQETKTDIVKAVLETTAEKLKSDKVFGSATPDDWRWGRIHTVTLGSLFSSAGITQFDSEPFVNDGGFFTVDVANPTGRGGDFDDDFTHSAGASLRVVFEVTDDGSIEGWFQLPGGQDHHRDSQWYLSLMDDWLSNTPRKLLFERSEVESEAVQTLQLGPFAE